MRHSINLSNDVTQSKLVHLQDLEISINTLKSQEEDLNLDSLFDLIENDKRLQSLEQQMTNEFETNNEAINISTGTINSIVPEDDEDLMLIEPNEFDYLLKNIKNNYSYKVLFESILNSSDVEFSLANNSVCASSTTFVGDIICVEHEDDNYMRSDFNNNANDTVQEEDIIDGFYFLTFTSKAEQMNVLARLSQMNKSNFNSNKQIFYKDINLLDIFYTLENNETIWLKYALMVSQVLFDKIELADGIFMDENGQTNSKIRKPLDSTRTQLLKESIKLKFQMSDSKFKIVWASLRPKLNEILKKPLSSIDIDVTVPSTIQARRSPRMSMKNYRSTFFNDFYFTFETPGRKKRIKLENNMQMKEKKCDIPISDLKEVKITKICKIEIEKCNPAAFKKEIMFNGINLLQVNYTGNSPIRKQVNFAVAVCRVLFTREELFNCTFASDSLIKRRPSLKIPFDPIRTQLLKDAIIRKFHLSIDELNMLWNDLRIKLNRSIGNINSEQNLVKVKKDEPFEQEIIYKGIDLLSIEFDRSRVEEERVKYGLAILKILFKKAEMTDNFFLERKGVETNRIFLLKECIRNKFKQSIQEFNNSWNGIRAKLRALIQLDIRNQHTNN